MPGDDDRQRDKWVIGWLLLALAAIILGFHFLTKGMFP